MKRALSRLLDFPSVTLSEGRKQQEGKRPAVVFGLTVKSVRKQSLP